MVILIDASVFCSYFNEDDVHHAKATDIMKGIITNENAITTDYIFDETITVIQRRTNKEIAVESGNFILESEISIFEIDNLVFQKAWGIFKQNNSFSFTDCASIASMQIFGISKIATFDKEFKKMKDIEVIS